MLSKKFFDIDGDLVFCNNTGMLMTEVSIEHKQKMEWQMEKMEKMAFVHCITITHKNLLSKKGCCPVLLLVIS